MPSLLLDDLQPFDLVGGRDDAFGQAEAEGEVLEVLRRRHHHGVGAAVVGEGDRGLLRDRALAVGEARRRRQAVRATRSIGGATRLYSAASTAGAMRRLSRENSSYSSCQRDGPFDGEICTAVTLYSGQLVAQSEKSVVMTLACVSG